MTTLDWLIVAATLMFAVSGYFRGFIVGALSLAGFVAGAIAGTPGRRRVAVRRRLLALRAGVRPARRAGGRRDPGPRPGGCRRPPAPRPPPAVPGPRSTARSGRCSAPRSRSARLGRWASSRLALPGSGSLASEIRRSAILRRLDELLPPSGVVLHALARIDPLPAIAAGRSVAPPPAIAAATPRSRAPSAASCA